MVHRFAIAASASLVFLAGLLGGCSGSSSSHNAALPPQGVQGGSADSGMPPYLYASLANELFLISEKSNTFLQNLGPASCTAGYSLRLALSPDGTRLYVATSEQTANATGPNPIKVIDTATNQVIGTIQPEPNLAVYFNIAVSPDGSTLAAAGATITPPNQSPAPNQYVVLMSTATGTTLHSLNALDNGFIAYDPSGTHLYQTGNNETSTPPEQIYGQLDDIDTSTGTIVHQYTYAGEQLVAQPGIVDPTGHYLYLSDFTDAQAIDLSTGAIAATMPRFSDQGPIGVQQIALNPAGDRLYAFSDDDTGPAPDGPIGEIYVWNPITRTKAGTIVLQPRGPNGNLGANMNMTINKAGTELFYASNTDVYVVDLATNALAHIIPLPSGNEPSVNDLASQ